MQSPNANPALRLRRLRVPVNREEAAEIERKAAAAGRKVAPYMRAVAMGYELHGILDHLQVEELARINGDLGRLGGLLKLWLTNDERTRDFGESTIRAVLAKIEATQDLMQGVIRAIVSPNADR